MGCVTTPGIRIYRPRCGQLALIAGVAGLPLPAARCRLCMTIELQMPHLAGERVCRDWSGIKARPGMP
jgi:hypothetical protein